MAIDTHSATWKAIEQRLQEEATRATKKLISGHSDDDDRLRGRIDMCNTILGMPEETELPRVGSLKY